VNHFSGCLPYVIYLIERSFIVNCLVYLGTPKGIISTLEKYNPTKEQAEEFIKNEKSFIRHIKRALVYDCCEMAAADGNFTPKERDVVEAFAKRIGVDNSDTDKIMKAFDEENEAKKKRIALLFPDGVDTTIQTVCDEKSKTVGRAS
jgi:Tellurite resistance protein TerB